MSTIVTEIGPDLPSRIQDALENFMLGCELVDFLDKLVEDSQKHQEEDLHELVVTVIALVKLANNNEERAVCFQQIMDFAVQSGAYSIQRKAAIRVFIAAADQGIINLKSLFEQILSLVDYKLNSAVEVESIRYVHSRLAELDYKAVRDLFKCLLDKMSVIPINQSMLQKRRFEAIQALFLDIADRERNYLPAYFIMNELNRLTQPTQKHICFALWYFSELPWRMLSRAHGAELCYTPMIHSSVFQRDASYRADFMTHANETADRPLIAQFCSNSAETLVDCVRTMEPYCDGVDLNLGCPQTIARRGYYGAFLQDDWTRIHDMVSAVHRLCSKPITVKIRVFDDAKRTVEYAQMIEGAGAQILTVHGRTREMKGTETGMADWGAIANVRKNIQIPMFANGNIQLYSDIDKCLEATGCQGVMTAEGNLHNPYLFEKDSHPCHWLVAAEYMHWVHKYPVSLSHVRGHLFKLFHHSLLLFPEIQMSLGNAGSIEEMDRIVDLMRKQCEPMHAAYLLDSSSVSLGNLMMPHWLCQPYYRAAIGAPAEDDQISMARRQFRAQNHETLQTLMKTTGWSKRKLRRLQRHRNNLNELCQDAELAKHVTSTFERRRIAPGRVYTPCELCGNPQGDKCVTERCKRCCKTQCYKEKLNCKTHNLWYGDKTEYHEHMKKRKIKVERKKKMAADIIDDDDNAEIELSDKKTSEFVNG